MSTLSLQALLLQVMGERASLSLFVAGTLALSVAAIVVVSPLLRRRSLKFAVPALAVVGPVLAVLGSLVGAMAMTLSGRDVWSVLLISACTAVASTVVGLRLAQPVARDLDRVAATVRRVAEGDRAARTGVVRSDEVGRLAEAVDRLSGSLARAEQERAAADEERRAVVGALSHDLRTPLASLLASVDALADGVGERASHLRAMRGNVLALESLVGDLFLLARADSGSLGLAREPLDLTELIDEAVEAVEPVASVAGLRVVAEADGPMVVAGDHPALGRVLRNLLDNALRHSPPGGTVTIHQATGHRLATVEVRDEGPGFPAGFADRAFDRFSQADDARHRRGASGLGLAIAQTLVQAHHGSVRIEPGPGGRVILELPLLEADDSATVQAEGDADIELAPGPRPEREVAAAGPAAAAQPATAP